jgi:hypothetical protein
MSKYGLVKVLKHGDDEIKLVGNAMTFILYKSYFGRDLLNDVVEFARKNSSKEWLAKLDDFKDLDIKNVAEEQATELLGAMGDYQFDSEFILNFIACLIATAKYPEKLDIGNLIMKIPPHFIVDTEVVSEVLEFLTMFIGQKKEFSNNANRGSV